MCPVECSIRLYGVNNHMRNQLGIVHLIFRGGGGGGAWVFWSRPGIFFRVPVKQRRHLFEYRHPSSNTLNSMRAIYAQLRIIIIDERQSWLFIYPYLFYWRVPHLFSQNPATNTENSAQSRSDHIFMELTLFVYNINSQYFCIKSGLNYLRYKRYKRNETEGHIFFCNLNFHRNGIHILYIDCYHHRKIYIFYID